MFENIIGQEEIVRTLRSELPQGRFPRSSLFFGPPYAGKLSTALEAARALTCARGSAEWSCGCPSCGMQKELLHPHTVLLGPRYADIEIAACADALMRSRKPATLFLFLRAVRKLTRRFDPSILDTDDARLKGVQEKVARIEEALAECAPGKALPSERELGDILERIISAAAPVAEQVRGDSITIGQVRRLAGWAHLTASGSRKVAVIENADRMQDSARNALLKLLEEPPEAVHLILLSSRRAAITPTILSRLRPYPFAQRSAAEEREVMEKIFRSETPGFESLRAFFLAWREINPEKLSQLARRFIDMVQAAEPAAGDIGAQMAEILPERKAQRDRSSRETGSAFLEELMARFRDLLRGGRVNVDTLEQWNQAVREAHARLETYNMNPSSILEALFYRMRDASRQQGDASRQQGDASRQQGDASRQQGDGARADNERRVSAGERARQEAGR